MQRRQFFKISAGVAFSLSSLPMTAIAADKSDVRSNVLVVGGGMAGLCAAISAKQSEASKVILVEKGGFLGGHSILSGSGYWIGGTKIQKKAGIDDSLEINWQDSLERGLKLNRFLKRDTGVARLVYEQGPKDLDWLESLGVKFTDQPAQAIGNRKRVHYFAPGYRVGSPQAIKALQAKAESLGVEIILNTNLVSLITESEKRNARVIGAILENNTMKIGEHIGILLLFKLPKEVKEMIEDNEVYSIVWDFMMRLEEQLPRAFMYYGVMDENKFEQQSSEIGIFLPFRHFEHQLEKNIEQANGIGLGCRERILTMIK